MADAGNSRLIRAFMSNFGGNFFALVFAFLTVSISARVLPEESLGVYFLLMTIAYLLQALTSVGIKQAATRFIAGAPDDDERQQIVNNVLMFCVLVLVAGMLLAVVGRPVLVSLFNSPHLAEFYVYAALLMSVTVFDQVLDAVMQGYQLYHRMALVRSIGGVVNFGLTFVFLCIIQGGIAGIVLATVLSTALTALIRYRMIPGAKRLRFNPAIQRGFVRFGLPIQCNDILTFISERVDILLVGTLLTPAAVAYLGVAWKIPQNLYKLFQSVIAVFYPHIANLFGQGQQTDAEISCHHFVRFSSVVTTGGALLVILFQREIVALIFSERYLSVAPALAVLMLVLIFSTMTTILDHALIAAGHSRYLPLISLADTVPNVIANLLLIPALGFMGAVYARLIANITTLPVVLWSLHREKIHIPIIETVKPVVVLVVCLVMYFAIGCETFICRVAILALFGAMLLVFSVITSHDAAALLRSVKPIFHQGAVTK